MLPGNSSNMQEVPGRLHQRLCHLSLGRIREAFAERNFMYKLLLGEDEAKHMSRLNLVVQSR